MSRRPPSGTWPKTVEHIPVDFLQSPDDIAKVLRDRNIKPDYIFFFSYVLVTDDSGALQWDDERLVSKNSEYRAPGSALRLITFQTTFSPTFWKRFRWPLHYPSVSLSSLVGNGSESTLGRLIFQTKKAIHGLTSSLISTTLNTTSSPPSVQNTASGGIPPSHHLSLDARQTRHKPWPTLYSYTQVFRSILAAHYSIPAISMRGIRYSRFPMRS